ncbi:MAG: alpha/beta hydrolase family protein [Planctomycetota bacterium]|jgi:acetyl esterase/lipase
MKQIHLLMLTVLVATGCERGGLPRAGGPKGGSLAQARRGFSTKIVRTDTPYEPVPQPPARLYHTVHYLSPAGDLAAYVSTAPADGKPRPAIIWIPGGMSNSIGSTAWEPAASRNDQSARAFREAGIVTMFPSLRGGNDNPGLREAFYGEVDDILAARDYLARQDYVDPGRIYLGGHSTGGTLALLVAECTDKFRAVFAFGPAADVRDYGAKNVPFDTSDDMEWDLRSPIHWLGGIRTPTFVFEGGQRPGNIKALTELSRASANRLIRFHPVQGADHFSILAPVTRVIAAEILRDVGPTVSIDLTEQELVASLRR